MSHWRETYRAPRFLIFDYRVGIVLVIFFLHIRLWTLYLCVIFFLIFWFIERAGYSVPATFRYLRRIFSSDLRLPLSKLKMRQRVDDQRFRYSWDREKVEGIQELPNYEINNKK